MSFSLPKKRLEMRFPDKKPAMTEGQAVAEALRCLYCHDAPCIRACPTRIPIPEFIRKIGTGNVKGSARTILGANILGFSCARVCPVEVLCEGACVYHDRGMAPIQIGRLQRYSTDQAVDKGWRLFHPGASTGKKVAIVGGGPAGLACAHELCVLGHKPVIFEKREFAGGLNATGVAAYKMKSQDGLREAEYVLGIGIEVRFGQEVGGKPSWAQLEKEFDAVFLGVGLGRDSLLGVPGEDLKGCVGAVELIEQIKLDSKLTLANVERAAVVGGGNTAIDVVRQLRGLGVPEVALVYRRSEEEMPGYEHEWAAAMKDGVTPYFLRQPVAIKGKNKVERLTLMHMELGEPDESGRRKPSPVAGSEHDVYVDLVVQAVGQERLEELVAGIKGLRTSRGRILVDPETGATGNPKYFAGGDVANGGKEVVNASADGKLAARSIDAYLKKSQKKASKGRKESVRG